MDRREWLLSGLTPEGLALEIGGGPGPLVAGDARYNARSLDHLDRAGLVEKYRQMGEPTDRIAPVDYVWSGQRYLDLVGDTRFDFIVASHVIEHVPDFAGFLLQCAEVLAPGGILSLAVPDHRCEFDHFRMPSGLGGVIDAHLQDRRLSSPGLAAEFALNFANLDGRHTWVSGDTGHLALEHPAQEALHLLKHARAGEYLDIHSWVFTPNSFRLLIEDLHTLGLTPLREQAFVSNNDHEFLIQLSPTGLGPGVDRVHLCRAALADLRRAGPEGGDRAGAAELRLENERLRQELAAMNASTSWRVTAPLRAARRLAQRG